MLETFGARLRQARERRQITLADIADKTKIQQSILAGLERDDVSHWPAGIFRRSFVRDYALMVGLEPEAVVREFLELYPDPIEDDPSALLIAAEEGDQSRPPTRLGCLLASLGSRRRFSRPTSVPEQPVMSAVPAEGSASSAEFSTSSPPPAVAPANDSENILLAVGKLCSELSRAPALRDAGRLLDGVAKILDAAGLILWVWDPEATVLKPALAHGYSNELVARLPDVTRESNNATAASFRTGEPRVVEHSDASHGALVVPLLNPTGCGGVLALELLNGGEQKESVRALATIFAAQLSAFVWYEPVESVAEAVNG